MIPSNINWFITIQSIKSTCYKANRKWTEIMYKPPCVRGGPSIYYSTTTCIYNQHPGKKVLLGAEHYEHIIVSCPIQLIVINYII